MSLRRSGDNNISNSLSTLMQWHLKIQYLNTVLLFCTCNIFEQIMSVFVTKQSQQGCVCLSVTDRSVMMTC